MLASLLRRLTGPKPTPVRPAAPPPAPPAPVESRADVDTEMVAAAAPVAEGPPPSAPAVGPVDIAGLEPAPGQPPGSGPVFSSRAVRDATVVTSTIEALNRFVSGHDLLDDLTWRLEALTPDQVNFLQLSAEPGLIQRAQARSETLKGTKASALRKVLTDLASGAIPEPTGRHNPLVTPKTPILPPLASLQARMPAPTPPIPMAPVSAPTSVPLPPVADGTDVAEPVIIAPVIVAPVIVPLAPLLSDPQPVAARSEPVTTPVPTPPEPPPPPDPVPAAVILPTSVAATASVPLVAPVAARLVDPVPAPDPEPVPIPVLTTMSQPAVPPSPPVTPAPPIAVDVPTANVPRLDRQRAEARRAQLLASLNDHLSASEASP